MKPYAVYHSDGTLWRAGKTVFGLCSAYNHATNPSKPMSETDHKRSFAYARAIKNRIKALNLDKNIRELSDGSFWPIK